MLPDVLTVPVNALLALANFQLSRRAPRFVAGALRRAARRQLPSGYDVDTHFRPSYGPWDQRLCIAPDGDLFTAIRRRRASVATDTVAGFTPTGVRLGSGDELPCSRLILAVGHSARATYETLVARGVAAAAK